jgi:hypothetical protein
MTRTADIIYNWQEKLQISLENKQSNTDNGLT